MQNLVNILAIIIAIGSAIFVAFQTRILAQQTKMLQRTTELSYNLEVISQMNEIILQIAGKRKSRIHVWGKASKENSLPHHEGRIFLDVLDAAVSGVNRLSKFEDSEFENWAVYAEYVLQNSKNLRGEVCEHPNWWPDLALLIEKLTWDAGPPAGHLVAVVLKLLAEAAGESRVLDPVDEEDSDGQECGRVDQQHRPAQ